MHHHGDLHQAIITVGTVIVGIKFLQWVATQVAKVSPSLGASIGGAVNLGTH
jgi:hypothetical protein